MAAHPDGSRRRFVLATGSALALGAGLSACGGSSDGGGSASATERFGYGVASGDPLTDRVILWTRVNELAAAASIDFEVASDPLFATIVRRGTGIASPDRDWCVKVDADGLQPGTWYWYRFRFGTEVSAVGRTKTLPAGGVQQVRMAVFSCAAYSLGQFHAYNHAANRSDLDVALMLGDYIYETGLNNAEQAAAAALGRAADPQHECVTLTDYRQRYARYHRDADLRALRGTTPLIAVWDDHEIVNDTWRAGAGGHDPSTEGSFTARRAAAAQAFHEWLPTRTGTDPLKIYRSFDFGNLVSLHMLDTRVAGREAPLNRDTFLAGASEDPSRQLLGVEQEAWLAERMRASTATWQVLGQQVVFGPMRIPLSVNDDFSESTINTFLQAQATPEASRTDVQKALLSQPRIGYQLSNWDSFAAARERVLAMATSGDRNLVVLSGDSHNAWGHDLRDASGTAVGVEFATTSVTSTGLELEHPKVDSAFLADAFTKMIPDLRFAETKHRGYLTMNFTPQGASGQWVFVSSVISNDYTVTTAQRNVFPGAGNRVLVA